MPRRKTLVAVCATAAASAAGIAITQIPNAHALLFGGEALGLAFLAFLVSKIEISP